MKNKESLIIKGYKFKLYPTPEQEHTLVLWSSYTRWLWNSLLALEMKTYREQKIFLWQKELNEITNNLKKDPEMKWLSDLPSHSVQFVINNLLSALKGSSKKASNRKGFPKFKKKRWGIGCVYMVNDNTTFFEEQHKVKLPKLEKLIKYRGDTLPEGRLVCSKIIRDGDNWYLSSQFECKKPEQSTAKVERCAVDLGVSRFATIYDGEKFEHVDAPKYLRKAERILKKRQHSLSRKERNSNRRLVQVRRVRSAHQKVARKRLDFLHQLSHKLITKASEICAESLNIQGMLKNHCLAKSISDASMEEFLRQLKYKSDWYGRNFVQVDRWFASSQICSSCGKKHPEMKDLGRRTIVCECGLVMDRDENAALNIYRYGEELRNRLTAESSLTTDAETGDHGKVIGSFQVPIEEASIIKPLKSTCALLKV